MFAYRTHHSGGARSTEITKRRSCSQKPVEYGGTASSSQGTRPDWLPPHPDTLRASVDGRANLNEAVDLGFPGKLSREVSSETLFLHETIGAMLHLTQLSKYLLANFRGLILGCIEVIFPNQILVGKLLTRSVRFKFHSTY